MTILINILMVLLLMNNFSFHGEVIQVENEVQAQNAEGVIVYGWIKSEEKIDISDVPLNILQNKINDDGFTTFYIENEIEKTITYLEIDIFDLKFSPDKNHIAFFYHPDNNPSKDIAIVVMSLKTRETGEIYRKNVRTSYWTWDDSDHIIVRYNAGTGLLLAYNIDIYTAEIVDEYFEYKDPIWDGIL